jgi:hypothetical protein
MLTPPAGREPSPSRRQSRRRKTYDLRILVSDTQGDSLWPGWVVDSSNEGLRLKLIGSMPPVGAILKVHRFHVPKLDASLVVRVVHSKCFDYELGSWLVGCAFVEPPPVSTLVHFS